MKAELRYSPFIHNIYDFFQKGHNTYEVLLSWSKCSCYIRMWMTGIIDIRITHLEFAFFSWNQIKENEVSLIQLNDSASFHLRKMYDILLQRKVLSFLSKSQVMDLIIWKEICILNVFLLFHKTDSRRMRSHWPNLMTVQFFICEKCTTSFAKESFWFLIKGSNHEGFYYLKGNMHTECIFTFS